MKYFIAFLFSFACTFSYGQDVNYTNEEINLKLDSILKEANLLYKYERSSWVSTDLALANSTTKNNFGGFLTYENGGSFKTIILDKGLNKCVAEFNFKDDFNKPKTEVISERELTQNEMTFQKIKTMIIEQLSETKYEVSVPEGFSLNVTLMPENDGYKMYMIAGTDQSNVIPFGNDYLFYTDKEGVIQSWKKFHSRLIPVNTTAPNGGKIIMPMHSHLRTTPFISATDICTFKLYAGMYDINFFSVYSPALGKTFKYDLSKDKVEIIEKQ
jgi:hypothetical protein